MPFDEEPETHPAFGMAQVNRVTCGPTGLPLFDSELLHHQFVMLRITRAKRYRELNRDWIHGENHTLMEVRMSMAQWGALVSSFGSSGVPVTLSVIGGEPVEEIEHKPRMAESLREIDAAAERFAGGIAEAAQAVQEAFDRKAGRRELAALLRSLQIRLANGKPNVRYVAEAFSEHVENTVTKARADIEAMAQSAAQRGITVGGAADVLALPADVEEPTG